MGAWFLDTGCKGDYCQWTVDFFLGKCQSAIHTVFSTNVVINHVNFCSIVYQGCIQLHAQPRRQSFTAFSGGYE